MTGWAYRLGVGEGTHQSVTEANVNSPPVQCCEEGCAVDSVCRIMAIGSTALFRGLGAQGSAGGHLFAVDPECPICVCP